MSDAPVDPVPSSQLPAKAEPLLSPKEPELATNGSVLASPSPAGSGQQSAPAGSSGVADPPLPLEEPDSQTRARKISADLAHSTDAATDGHQPVVELAVVKAGVEVTSKIQAVRNDGTAPPQEGADEEQANEKLTGSASTSRQGYGTFQTDPAQPEGSVGTSTLNAEEASVLSTDVDGRNLSNWMVFTNLMKASMGTGILAMPMAIRNAGSVVGSVLFTIIAFVCIYCIHLLVESSRTLRKKLKVQTLEYADTAGAAFKTSSSPCVQCMAPFARGFTEVFLAVYMIGTCSVYVLFVKENLKQLFDVSCKENEWSSVDYLIHLALVLMVLVAIPNLSSLSVVSFIANVTMVAGVVMCLGIICNQIIVDHQAPQLEYNRTLDTWSNKTVHNVTVVSWAGWDRIPLFFGTAVFALEGIGVVLTLENQMKDPANFLDGVGVLNIAMGIITVLYLTMGTMGYLAYGETTKGSITLNLPPDSTLAFWVRKTVTLGIFLTYPLQFYIPEEILWKWLSGLLQATLRVGSYEPLMNWADQCRTWQMPRFAFKILLMFATVCLPLAVPRLGPAIALVGAVCLSMLGLILPTIIYTITHWRDIRPSLGEVKTVFKMIVHFLIVLIGLLGLVTGAYSSIEEIKELKAANE